MITIKHHFTEQTICEFDVATIKEAAEQGKANLDSANLGGADLRGADLDGEKITKNPISVVGLRYWCLISDNYMRLGCKRFTHAEWTAFNDEQINEMDTGALEFWAQWKTPLLAMCQSHATLTKVES